MQAFEFQEADDFTSGGKYEDNPSVQVVDKKFTSVRDYMKIKETQLQQMREGPMHSNDSEDFYSSKFGPTQEGNHSMMDH